MLAIKDIKKILKKNKKLLEEKYKVKKSEFSVLIFEKKLIKKAISMFWWNFPKRRICLNLLNWKIF